MSSNLSYINSMKDLESAENLLRYRVSQRETLLQQQVAELPGKLTRNLARKTLPFLIGAGVAAIGTRLVFNAIRNRSAKKLNTNRSIIATPMTVIKNSPIVPFLLPLAGKLVRTWIEKKVQRRRENV